MCIHIAIEQVITVFGRRIVAVTSSSGCIWSFGIEFTFQVNSSSISSTYIGNSSNKSLCCFDQCLKFNFLSIERWGFGFYSRFIRVGSRLFRVWNNFFSKLNNFIIGIDNNYPCLFILIQFFGLLAQLECRLVTERHKLTFIIEHKETDTTFTAGHCNRAV